MLNFRSPIVQQNFGYLMDEQPDFKSMTPEEMTAYHREHLAKQREKEAMMSPEEKAAKFREGQLYYQELAERQRQEELYNQQQMMYQQPVNNQYYGGNPYLAYQQQMAMQQQYQQPINQYQQQPYYYTAPGYNYYQQPVNNQYYGGYYQPQPYNNGYYGYNPYLEYQQQMAAYKQQQEVYANQIKMERRLEEIALKYLGHDPEEIKEYLENKYNPKPQEKQEDYSIVSKCKYVITCYRGDEEVYCSYDEETDDYARESYEDTYKTYYDMVKPTLARVNYLEAVQNYQRNYVNPNYERALKQIEEERNKLIDPNCNLHEFLKNGYKLYVEAMEMKTREQQNQLNKLFNRRKFESSVGIRGNGDTGGSIDFNRVFNSTSVDDYEITLPDRLRTEYSARKRAFIEKCVERCMGGGS